jgi:ribosomal protein S21
VQVLVRENNVDQALRALKKKMQREGIFREMKLRGHYEKPSEKKAREKAEAARPKAHPQEDAARGAAALETAAAGSSEAALTLP